MTGTTHLHIRQFLEFIQEAVHGELAGQILQSSEGKALGGAIRYDTKNKIQIEEVFSQVGNIENGFFIGGCIMGIMGSDEVNNSIGSPSRLLYTWKTPLSSSSKHHGWGSGIEQSSKLNTSGLTLGETFSLLVGCQ